MEQPIRSDQGARIVPLRTAAPPPPPVAELFAQAMRIAVGIAVLSTDALVEAVARTLGSEPDAASELESEEGPPPSGLPLLAGAALGVAVETVRWGARALETMGRTAELMFGIAPRPAIVRQPVERATGLADGLDARWREQRPRDEEAATAFLQLLVPQIVDAVLDQVDLNELVEERLDLDRVVARIDLDEVAARIDLDRIVERLDLHALVQRLPVDEVADRIDVERIVSRVDLDAVAGRIDVEAIVRRLDLGSIAREVIDEIDLGAIIRDAMGSMTTETVGGIRVQSMNADRAISRIVDRVLQRRGDRDDPSDPDRGDAP